MREKERERYARPDWAHTEIRPSKPRDAMRRNVTQERCRRYAEKGETLATEAANNTYSELEVNDGRKREEKGGSVGDMEVVVVKSRIEQIEHCAVQTIDDDDAKPKPKQGNEYIYAKRRQSSSPSKKTHAMGSII
ncbi:hypothetical protein K504DRAFT_463198 [Pleomassaria siparia CBS 279.74]|uniref:Uncharacterized protein n=1 Tax=Pleomassaria siparia CBS 279.74 TaxID=1314801 RepID=A0A6G1JUB6_9PLEO|nr:hypothetical protein K504DRAFT_463198 [Pleomassaria siparia CBS 279.74]